MVGYGTEASGSMHYKKNYPVTQLDCSATITNGSSRTHNRRLCAQMFVNAKNKCRIIKQPIPIRRLFMNHLHVTHITEGLRIVKYRAPFIRHKYNKNKATVTYTKHIGPYTRHVHLSVYNAFGKRLRKELPSLKAHLSKHRVTKTYTLSKNYKLLITKWPTGVTQGTNMGIPQEDKSPQHLNDNSCLTDSPISILWLKLHARSS